jgi:hypothetical protein
MNPQNVAKLVEAAPDFFAQKVPIEHPFDERGIEIDNGWFKPVLEMAKKIQAIIMTLPPEQMDDFRCHQLKSKFAGLRVYVSGTANDHPGVRAAIEKATKACKTLCEMCGEPGIPVAPGGWMFVFCKDHFERYIEDRIKRGTRLKDLNVVYPEKKTLESIMAKIGTLPTNVLASPTPPVQNAQLQDYEKTLALLEHYEGAQGYARAGTLEERLLHFVENANRKHVLDTLAILDPIRNGLLGRDCQTLSCNLRKASLFAQIDKRYYEALEKKPHCPACGDSVVCRGGLGEPCHFGEK